MTFEIIEVKPGDVITSKFVNDLQKGLLNEITDLRKSLENLTSYVNNLKQQVTLTNLQSPVGKANNLDEEVPGGSTDYVPVIGLLTQHYMPYTKGKGDICQFQIGQRWKKCYYWAAAENGGQDPCINIYLEYEDETKYKIESLPLNDIANLNPPIEANPFYQFIYANCIFYLYAVDNPSEEKTVRSIKFEAINESTQPHIGNVLTLITRLSSIQ